LSSVRIGDWYRRAMVQRLAKVFLWLWIAGAAYASFAQLALQESAARNSSWGYTPGWQREIGFWNIGLIAILAPIALNGSPEIRITTVRGLVLLSALFGTNHAFEVARGGGLSHIGGMVENLAAVVFGLVVLVAARVR
jgi:hypothetical protein